MGMPILILQRYLIFTRKSHDRNPLIPLLLVTTTIAASLIPAPIIQITNITSNWRRFSILSIKITIIVVESPRDPHPPA